MTSTHRAAQRQRIALLMIVAACAVLVVIFLFAKAPVPPDSSRHVQSTITSLARYGADADPTWVYITSERDIWIRPDGSGEIQEQFIHRSFPTPAEEQQWLASDQPPYGGVNETFGPGDLFYYRNEQVRDGVADLGVRFAPAGDALRRIASLLSETVPTQQVADAALSTARSLNGATIEVEGATITISGLTGDGSMRVTLTFDTTPTRMIREVWHAEARSIGLDLSPPYLTFDRAVGLSEAIPGY